MQSDKARMIPGLAMALLLGASVSACSQAEFAPAPRNLPGPVKMMIPTSIPRDRLLVRDGCYYFRDMSGRVFPFDFASAAPGIPYCVNDTKQPTSILPQE